MRVLAAGVVVAGVAAMGACSTGGSSDAGSTGDDAATTSPVDAGDPAGLLDGLVITDEDLREGEKIFDIGPQTVKTFSEILKKNIGKNKI